ncbi:MAG: cyclopropane fatty acyl phospholipid synthase [Patescibacteria group bacterium]|nr:cyclopropane fatty acyl phospholipid synthase [Patescibacteria group bacterium]
MIHESIVKSLLEEAGIKINGNNPYDVYVNNERFYRRVLSQGSLGLGESYMEGWWNCKNLDEFFYKILRSQIDDRVKSWRVAPRILKAIVLNLGNKKHSFDIGKSHYDIGNEFYQNMLDKRLVYSCGYWEEAETLDNAQEAKLDLVCKKLNLKQGMKILDIGCGWGAFMKYASEKYGVKGVGITISKEQVKLGQELCRGLPVEIRLKDYRDLDGKFDCIVSIGMFEHVGYKNYRTYMEIVYRLLDDNGLFLLHTIGGNKSTITTDSWMNKYIFPGGMLPSIKQIGASIEGLFVMEDWHNFSADYDKTLIAWYKNFERNWDKIKSNYNKRFYRMWKYYLLCCAGTFRARKNQLWQIVFSKKGVLKGYESIR